MLYILLALLLAAQGCESTLLLQFWPIIEQNGPGIAFAVIAVAAGEAAKKFAPEKWKVFHDTLPWHPVIVGMIFGGFCHQYTPEWFFSDSGWIAGSMYFGMSGKVSTWLYSSVHHPLKSRERRLADA